MNNSPAEKNSGNEQKNGFVNKEIGVGVKQEVNDNVDNEIPKYGWSVLMNHKFPESWNQNIFPRLKQLPDLLPLFVRYFFWWIVQTFFRKRKPFIDLYMLESKQIYGVPLGGIGSGTIGRSFYGDFCRFQMTPGIYTYDIVDADQFILLVRDLNGNIKFHKVLNGSGNRKTLKSWDWTFNPENGKYRGLYPRAWYTYDIPEENIKLTCRVVSPVIPHNYKDSCFPGSTFEWTIENLSSEEKEISLTFTFKNGTGSAADSKGTCTSQTFSNKLLDNQETKIAGISIDHEISNNKTTYGIGCIEKFGQLVTHMTSFDIKNGTDIWKKLGKYGHLDTGSKYQYTERKGELGVALSNRMIVQGKSQENMTFALVWDQPKVYFNNKEFQHTRRYYNIFKSDNENESTISKLVQYSLSNVEKWNTDIENWQNPTLNDPSLPTWFKSAIFNELYYISDGGTQWFDYDESLLPKRVGSNDTADIRSEFGRFAYLESHEYRMFNTYDVHFYASFALIKLFPNIQLSIQYDIADSVLLKDETVRTYLFSGDRAQRKVQDSVPHDLGDPNEDPYKFINSYLIHDVSEWKDLNLKFVLQVLRDYKFTLNKKYLEDMLPVCDIVMKKSISWDKDGDGLIENSGFPDQTYDTWIMKGPSAYCGGLWLASLFAIIEMINEVKLNGNESPYDIHLYQELLKKGSKSYQDKLWNGEYYIFDVTKADSVMSDILAGHWYLALSDLNDETVFPKANVLKCLQTIYEKNVLGFQNGTMGAVNGSLRTGGVDNFSMQSEEIWTGTTYGKITLKTFSILPQSFSRLNKNFFFKGLASLMIKEGLLEEGFKTASGIYETVYNQIGLSYSTPEALYGQYKKYRAVGYMRPLAIYSMLISWDQRKTK